MIMIWPIVVMYSVDRGLGMIIWRFSKTNIENDGNYIAWEKFYNKKPTKEILEKSLKDEDDLEGVDIEQILEKERFECFKYCIEIYMLDEFYVEEI